MVDRGALKWLVLLLAAWLPAAGQAGGPLEADPYQQALAAARREASAGRFDGAARLLEPAVASWPQDLPLLLARGWYLLRAGRSEAAARAYREALELSPGSAEAAAGLDDALAGRGAPDQLWLGLAAGATLWRGQPQRTSLLSGALSLDGVVQDAWRLGLTWRGFTSPLQGSSSGLSSLSQEGQLAVGYAASDWSLTLHGAAASSASSSWGGAKTVYAYQGLGAGLAASLRLGLEWRASLAMVSWSDQASLQADGIAALPLWRHLWLEAGWRGQRLDGRITGAALAGVAWKGSWTLSLRGETGSQRRPWDLDGRALYGLPETLRQALRLQASVPLTPSLHGWLAADLERWRAPASTADATASRLTGGLAISF